MSNNLGRIIKQQRVMRGMTLGELAAMSGVSSSHLARIERGQRFPSAHVLRRIAKPLGFEEMELFTLAGFLSLQTSAVVESSGAGQLDPHVAATLSQEPPEIQRAVVAILRALKR